MIGVHELLDNRSLKRTVDDDQLPVPKCAVKDDRLPVAQRVFDDDRLPVAQHIVVEPLKSFHGRTDEPSEKLFRKCVERRLVFRLSRNAVNGAIVTDALWDKTRSF